MVYFKIFVWIGPGKCFVEKDIPLQAMYLRLFDVEDTYTWICKLIKFSFSIILHC